MKIRVETALVRMQYLVLVGIVIAQVLGVSSVSSLLFTGTFFLTVCFWLVRKKKNIDLTGLLGLGVVILSLASVLINAAYTNTMLSFSYLKKMIMFWSTILLLDAMCKYCPDHKTVRLIFRCNTLLSVLLIAVYYAMPETVFLFRGSITDYLTFRFTNPNLAGVFLSCIGILEVLNLYLTPRMGGKLVHLVLSGFLLKFIFETRSRNSILVICLFVCLYLICLNFHRRRIRVSRKMAVLVSIAPMIFAVVYLLYVYTPWVQELLEVFTGEGKKLDSRVTIWMNAVRSTAASPLFGAYSQISEGTGQSQLHNTHMDVMASYGIPVLVLLCVFLYRVITACKQKSDMNFICLVGFAAVLMSGIGEGMLFSGGLGIYIYAGMFLLLANYDFENRG